MKVQELINRVHDRNFDMHKDLEIKSYIPMMDKKLFAMDVIAACTDENDGFVSVDRFKMNIYFNMKVLESYTNLEIESDFNDMIAQYDILCENKLLNNILSLFYEDYQVMYSTLEGLLEELLIQNSIEAQVVRIANKISGIIDMANKSLDGLELGGVLPEISNLTEFINKLK